MNVAGDDTILTTAVQHAAGEGLEEGQMATHVVYSHASVTRKDRITLDES